MRVVLDTDVMVAAFRSRSGASRQWLKAALRREVTPIVSVPLLLQYEEVLTRPEQLQTIQASSAQVGLILDALCAVALTIEISYLWRPMLRDPDDEMVLEAAMQGQADALLTFNAKDFSGAEQLGINIRQPGPAWRSWMKGRQ